MFTSTASVVTVSVTWIYFFFFPSRGCVWVCPGFRQRLTTIPWKSETDPQPRLHWSANTTAPKHLISWFPHPTSCSCCSPQTTAAPRRASVSDMRVRLIEVFGWPPKNTHLHVHEKRECLLCDLNTHLNIFIAGIRPVCVFVLYLIGRCDHGVRLLSWSWYSSQWPSPRRKLFHWFPGLICMRCWIHAEWSGANHLWANSSVESRSA